MLIKNDMEWLIYLSKVTVCTALFYSFYHFFLRKLTFFHINRSYLITTLILSLVIPALQFNVEVAAIENTQPIPSGSYVDGATGLTIPKDSYFMINHDEPVSKEIDWDAALLIAYGSVSLFVLANFLFQMVRLLTYTLHVTDRVGSLRIVFKPEGFTNCSFFNYVFVDQKDLSAWEMQVFLQHENAHATRYHSVDKMATALSKVLLWFNPFIYLYERELNQLHEYEADKLTSLSIGNQPYATLLLEKATKSKTHSLVHSFAVKPLKGRILMLFSNQSKNMKKLRYFAALPLFATLLFGFSVEYVPTAVIVGNPVQDSTIYKQRIKPTPEMIKGKQVFEEWRKTDDYKEKVRAMEQVAGKTLIGVVKDNPESINRGFKNSMLFVSNKVTYYLFLADGPQEIQSLLKPNSVVTVKVQTPMVDKEGKYIELRAGSLKVNGKEVYKMKPAITPPFLYEVNKVRFADGLVTKISSANPDRKEIQISANGYTFLLKVDNSQVSLSELDQIKVGDDLRFRFVHEVKTGGKAYLIKDWVSISKDIRSYGIKNQLMFAKFYEQVSSKKAVSSKTFTGKVDYHQDFGDRLDYSAKDSTVVNQDQSTVTLYGSASLKYNQFNITADQIVINTKKQTVVARNASFYDSRTSSKIGVSDSIHFDLQAKKLMHYGIK